MVISNDILSLTGADQTFRWNLEAPLGTSVVVTYSFPSAKNAYDTETRPGFTGFSESHIAHIEQALATWGAVGGLSFVRVPQKVGGDIQPGMFDMTGILNAVGNQVSGWGYYPRYTNFYADGDWQKTNTHQDLGGDIFMNANFYAAAAGTMAPGMRGYSILLHEIGHAIGFKHPFSGTPTIEPTHDNSIYTVMSYSRPNSTISLGIVDVQAVQHVYGNTDLNGRWNPGLKAVVHNGSAEGEWLLGSDINDVLRGNGGNDTLRGKAGSDRIYGGSGHDKIDAGDGNDLINPGPGRDTIEGGNGNDTLSYADTMKAVRVNLGSSKTGLGAKGDTITGIENLIGSNHGGDRLVGNATRNEISGLKGDDVLNGGGGKDQLFGGKGKDRLNGGEGNDQLTGGEGADIFIFARNSNKDVIRDFQNDLDQLNLKGFGFSDAADALSKASQEADDVVFRFGGDRLIVENVLLSELADDIVI